MTETDTSDELGVQLLDLLKRYFGYDSFRPLQEEIIRDAMNGRDVFALLPTGGGKSLCYQLPAVARTGLTVVVSPLIALMKDQVDALQEAGVAATFLNSSLDGPDARSRFSGLHNNKYRLLYVSPERLALPGFLETLKGWGVEQFAIDEAHCISEWGHDFRPEYRQLQTLREHFPGVPFMALTATATERVRGDIVKHLKLHDPGLYVASFNRPNLTYRVWSKESPYSQLLGFIKKRPGECGIVYCLSRKGAEDNAQRLRDDGIKAVPYHAGLEASERARNQELFLRDERKVVCATIAFGMGINKPNVRFVVHYDMPKNIEGYYQETGRAGRDGLPSDCLLLFSPGDVAKLTRFIEDMSDPNEQQHARKQLNQMVNYGECSTCRRSALLKYFAEDYPESDCASCDNCLAPRPSYDGTVDAQKFLSCIYRIKERGFGTGMKHVIEVLMGANTEKIRDWGHNALTTYGIGKEHDSAEWQRIGRELLRLGLCAQAPGKFPTLELTVAGKTALVQRKPITLTKPPVAKEKEGKHAGEIICDEKLFERLRALCKTIADERNIPAYVIFDEPTLRLMAQRYPTTEADFARISGVGEKKRTEFGDVFIREILDFLISNPKQSFAFSEPARVPNATGKSGDKDEPCDEKLFERLRALRLTLSKERSVAAFIICSDAVLKRLAREYPCDTQSLARIKGIGEKKAEEFGSLFIAEIQAHLKANPKREFVRAEVSAQPLAQQDSSGLNDTTAATVRFFKSGQSVAEIARSRGMTESTIYKHLVQAVEAGEKIALNLLGSPEDLLRVRAAFDTHGMSSLTTVFAALGEAFSYDFLRLYRAVSPGGKDAAEEGKEIMALRKEELRSVFPKAYAPWTADEDTRLLELFTEHADLETIATEMGRQPSSLTARHLKLTDPAAAEAKSQTIRAAKTSAPGQKPKWSSDDDTLLRALAKAGKKLDQLSIILQRSPGEIRERMNALEIK